MNRYFILTADFFLNLTLLFPCDPTSGQKACAYISSFASGEKFNHQPAQGLFPQHRPQPQPWDKDPTYFHLPKPAWTSAIKFLSNSRGVWSAIRFDTRAKFWCRSPLTSTGYYRTLLTRLRIEIESQVEVPNPKSLQTSWEDRPLVMGSAIGTVTDVRIGAMGA